MTTHNPDATTPPPASAPARPDNALRVAWGDMLEQLRVAGETVLGEHGATDALDEAEAFRFLTRLTSAAFDMFIEYGDTAHPSFVRLMTPHRKFYGDNPDTFYDYASIRGTRRYRITGTRGTSSYLAFCIYGRDDSGKTRIVNNVSDRDLDIAPDGSFELHLAADSPDHGGGSDRDGSVSWIETAPDVEAVIARQYFLDRGAETPATYSIACVDDTPAPALNALPLARRLRASGEFVATGALFSAIAASTLAENPNALTIDSDAAAVAAFYPTPDNKYVGGWFHLGPDDALVVEGQPPDSRYWSLVLMNRWMESLDAEHHQIILNNHQITLEPDGSFRIAVAHRDPGTANWLDTAGHQHGYVMFRWMQATNVTPPTFTVTTLPRTTSNDDDAGAGT